MAAPCKSHVRVKLFFDNACVEPSWAVVELQEMKYIQDFSDYICKKFLDSPTDICLSSSGCKFPPWEKTLVLRDGDEVHVNLQNNSSRTFNNSGTAACVNFNEYNNRQLGDSPEFGDNNTQQSQSRKEHKKKKKKKDKYKELSNVSQEDERTNACEVLNESALTCSGRDSKGKSKGKRQHVEIDENRHLEDESKSKRRKESSMAVEITNESSKDDENVRMTSNEKTTVDLSDSGLEICKNKRKRVRRRKKKHTADDSINEPSSVNNTPNVSLISDVRPINIWHTRKSLQSSNVTNIHKKFDSEEGTDKEDTLDNSDKMTKSFSRSQSSAPPVYADYGSVNGRSEPNNRTGDSSNNASTIQNLNGSLPSQSNPEDSFNQQKMPTTRVSVMSNGVTVYSRVKNRQNHSNVPTLSKEQQLNTKLTNRSIILENKIEVNQLSEADVSVERMDVGDQVSTDKKPMYTAIPLYVDYTQFPSMLNAPKQGDRIAFKVLEMSDDYTPAVSDYKEATVLSFDSSSKMVEFKYKEEFLDQRAGGKFEVTLDEDEDDNVSWTTSEPMQSLHWSALLEPRLICN